MRTACHDKIDSRRFYYNQPQQSHSVVACQMYKILLYMRFFIDIMNSIILQKPYRNTKHINSQVAKNQEPELLFTTFCKLTLALIFIENEEIIATFLESRYVCLKKLFKSMREYKHPRHLRLISRIIVWTK